MSFILSLLAANWQAVAGIGAAILAGLGIYAKGRSDQKIKTELRDVRDAIQIHKDGAAARAGVDPDRMHSDGFRRD